ncbi:MAG: phosphoesterase [Terracidiphilus sp.]
MLNSSGNSAFLRTEGVQVLRVCVFYHDKCFDGACSASLFTRFHRECIASGASYEYHGLVHRAGALFDESEFSGDENAIVDFKYCASPRITWWFDHHLSAFLTPEDQENFLACKQDPACGSRKFFDPDYTSCTSFLAHIGATRFGFNTAPVTELIHWANIVDGAKYESPESAVEIAAPAMKLTLIIESSQDDHFIPRLIPLLTEMPLAEVLGQPFVADLLPPLLERHQQAIELIRSRAEERDGTIFFDITDQPQEGYNKFIPYYLYPQATYSIGLSKSSFRTKVSVGSNPWTKADPAKMTNLAAICERYGGGGHARVGAISFPPDKGDQARAAAAEIVAELRAKNPMG